MAQSPVGAGYKNGSSSNIITPAIATMAMLVGLAGLFWQAANPKGDLSQLRYDLRDDLRRSEERTDREIDHIKQAISNRMLTVAEHQEFVRRTDKAADNLREEINRIRGDQVTRSEHVQHWNEQTERMNALNQRLKDINAEQNAVNENMRKEFGSTFTAADQMKNMQDQIKILQNQINTMSRGTPTAHGSATSFDRMQ